MSDCCTEKSSELIRPGCPGCGASCHRVSLITLLHQVKFPFNQQLEEQDDYYFCPNRHCDIGYFSTISTIPKQHLLSCHNIQAGWLCYCFDVSEARFRSAITAGTIGTLQGFVINKTRAGLCACEVRNPSGRCCLATLKAMEKDLLPH